MPPIDYFSRPSLIKETVILVVFNLAMLMLFINIDMLEWLYHLSRDQEAWELDELIPLGVSLTVSLLLFSYRRIIELGDVTQAFEHLSMRDPLTNLLNRRSGQLKLNSYHDKAKANNNVYSLIEIDIDDFRRVNSLYGNSIGDEILIAVSRYLELQLPKESLLVRWVDDRFLIFIPDIANQTLSLPETICNALSQQLLGSSFPITCSIGFTIWESNESVEIALANVEEALIEAKQAGKNRVKRYLAPDKSHFSPHLCRSL
ncbi:GGDEF domain-containing protein [Shewanella sp. UCD-KL12]|uniref:GGDEF domain-containing protein n=1 Tax=Shewanella sp. UCD-KL12 TaxID=1917163 RepID=UPI0009707A35|nr:GGDEF domain-containing protein [Shewanella sp. UCD-KL12]